MNSQNFKNVSRIGNMNYLSFSVFLTSLLEVSINPPQAYINRYNWVYRNISTSSEDCKYYDYITGNFCMTEFDLKGEKYAIAIPDYVSLISIKLNPSSDIFIAYKYKGPEWKLKVGVSTV